MITLWIIGAMFTFGIFAVDDDFGKELGSTIILILVILTAWPVWLGLIAGERLK